MRSRSDEGVTGREPGAATDVVLSVRDLTVEFATPGGWLRVVDGVSFDLGRGEVLGILGESGSGKTVTSLAMMGLIPSAQGRIPSGSVELGGRNLLDLSRRQLSLVRGRRIAMIFQEPSRSLNPAFTVGDQVAEVFRRHMDASRSEARERAIDLLSMVGIVDARRRFRDYPHQFSGGMCQRVMLASALACEPDVLIADEPTTALDVTVQAQVLDLMTELQERTGVGIVLITHDLGVVAEMCDRVAVMYAGQIVETAPVRELFHEPTHPYTAGLLAAIPKPHGTERRFGSIPGRVALPSEWPLGCRFEPRCDKARAEVCSAGPVALVQLNEQRASRCVRLGEVRLSGISSVGALGEGPGA